MGVLDPIVALEKTRLFYGLSKSAFYGPGGPARRLPVIQLSAKRKGVRLSAIEADLAAQTVHPKDDVAK
jgi:hypothetical protein